MTISLKVYVFVFMTGVWSAQLPD